MSKLKLGLIPQGSDCPFKDRCVQKAQGVCKHKGEAHPCAFSCALARLFDMVERRNREIKPIV